LMKGTSKPKISIIFRFWFQTILKSEDPQEILYEKIKTITDPFCFPEYKT
jgi:hypothetical protein